METDPVEVLDETNRFFEQVEDRLVAVAEVKRPIFRFMLLFSLIETLAKATYPREKSGVRFRRLIAKHSDAAYENDRARWADDKNRVSLPQLALLLTARLDKLREGSLTHSDQETPPQSDMEDLLNEVVRRLASWPCARLPRGFEVDPLPDELHIAACQKLVQQAQYTPLLWKMRNGVVHEGRLIGRQWDVSMDKTMPYYLGTIGVGTHGWDLVFPELFLRNLASACLESVKQHFLAEQRSPVDSFAFGPNWLSED